MHGQHCCPCGTAETKTCGHECWYNERRSIRSQCQRSGWTEELQFGALSSSICEDDVHQLDSYLLTLSHSLAYGMFRKVARHQGNNRRHMRFSMLICSATRIYVLSVADLYRRFNYIILLSRSFRCISRPIIHNTIFAFL